MSEAHRLDCENEVVDCRFIIQSENRDEALDLAQKHMKEVHGQEYTHEELQTEYVQTV